MARTVRKKSRTCGEFDGYQGSSREPPVKWPQSRADALYGFDMELGMACDAKAPIGDVPAAQRGGSDAENAAATECGSGATFGHLQYQIFVGTTSQASTAYLVRRDSRTSTARPAVSHFPWGSDFCEMLLAMMSHECTSSHNRRSERMPKQ